MGQGRDVVTKNFPFQHGAVEENMREVVLWPL
jgi:hypothetical protein